MKRLMKLAAKRPFVTSALDVPLNQPLPGLQHHQQQPQHDRVAGVRPVTRVTTLGGYNREGVGAFFLLCGDAVSLILIV